MDFQLGRRTCGYHVRYLHNGLCVRSFKILQVFPLVCLIVFILLTCTVYAGHIFYRLPSKLGNVTKRPETTDFLSKYLQLRLLVPTQIFRIIRVTILSKSHLVQTLFHGLQAILSYFLMLIFMTYNGWLCLAIVMGLVCGYFLFGWRSPAILSSSITDDHCSWN